MVTSYSSSLLRFAPLPGFSATVTPLPDIVWGLAYKLAGPQRAWRLNNHPLFADGPTGTYLIGNLVVWGQLAALLALAAALLALAAALLAGGRRRRGRQARAAAKAKLE